MDVATEKLARGGGIMNTFVRYGSHGSWSYTDIGVIALHGRLHISLL